MHHFKLPKIVREIGTIVYVAGLAFYVLCSRYPSYNPLLLALFTLLLTTALLLIVTLSFRYVIVPTVLKHSQRLAPRVEVVDAAEMKERSAGQHFVDLLITLPALCLTYGSIMSEGGLMALFIDCLIMNLWSIVLLADVMGAVLRERRAQRLSSPN
jgi:hypothetical protein